MLDTLNVTPPHNTTDDGSLWTYFNSIRTTLERSSPSTLRMLYLGNMVRENKYSYDPALGIARGILPEIHTALSDSQSFPRLCYVDLSLTLSIKTWCWEDCELREKSFADLIPTIDESGPRFNVVVCLRGELIGNGKHTSAIGFCSWVLIFVARAIQIYSCFVDAYIRNLPLLSDSIDGNEIGLIAVKVSS